MATTRPEVLAALEDLLLTTGIKVQRGDGLPADVPVDGIIVLPDGDPGEAEILIGDPGGCYLWSHRIEIEVAAGRARSSARSVALDDLVVLVGAALAADQTLGGRCDSVLAAYLGTEPVVKDGGGGVTVALIAVTLDYQTTSPLGI